MTTRAVSLLAALFGVSALGGYLYSRVRPAPPPPIMPRPTPKRVAQATHRLETLLRPLPSAPDAGRAAPRTLRVSQDDLNVYLAGNAAARAYLKSRGVQAAQVVLSPPNAVTLHAIFLLRGQPRTVLICGTLTPNPTQGVNFAATQAQAGPLPLPPGVVTTQAQTLLRGFVRRSHHRLPLTVQSVRVVGSTLEITGLPVSPQSPLPASPPAASPGRR